ncbi:glycosyltransferase family 2 protein [Gordonia aichiensis]|uniref:4,4'-diaponeurosporenoate glycosyltransferase n=1 Tax=Gordonia aichiensis NBRC 108223 TaxID=1220583 RepID=L7KJ63_9ACTN|nr:glycosyltransferase family 2 protein [Gordonia aichiensis]GAC48521.1 putative glycosyltransferase [Gordonia aichiensis NBRC 108223]
MTLTPLAAPDARRSDRTGMLTLSVVVPVFDEESTIGECLGRLCAQIDDIHEIVVVDNNSTDRGPDIVATLAEEYPQIRLISESRQGLVYARNAGMDAATGDLVARIDADTRVGDRWAKTIVGFFAADDAQTWSALCGRGEAYGVPFDGRFDKWKIRLHPLNRDREVREPSEIPVLHGSNMIVRREVWGRIRDRVSMRRDIFEDVDMGLCVQDTGGRNAFLPALTVGVSPRRMETGMSSFVTYMSFLPRTFALHKRYGLALGAAMVYLPALTALHAARLVLLRSYDPETGGFDVRNLLRQRADRLLP